MSQENVEVVRRLFAEWQAGLERGELGAGFDTELVADDLEWIVPEPLQGRSVWHGRQGFVEFLRTWTQEFEDWSLQAERVIDAGNDRVVALTRQSAIGKGSGVPVELSLGQVYELKDGRVTQITSYLTHAEALEAAGLPK